MKKISICIPAKEEENILIAYEEIKNYLKLVFQIMNMK